MYYPPEKPSTGQINRLRLSPRKSTPETSDLRGLLSEAQRVHGRLVELPWTSADELDTFVLTVELKIGDSKPFWTLYHGDGPNSIQVWNCNDQDFDLIFDVITMFETEVQRDRRKNDPPPAPIVEPVAAPPESTYFANLTPVDFDLLKKQSNVLLGHMLVEAGVLSAPTLDSALKLQEMVRNEQLTPMQACEALRRAIAREGGGSHQLHDSPSATPPAGKKQLYESADAKAVVELLKQSGLITEQDIQSVIEVKKKHGGDIGTILVSAGKIDKVTFDAATTCWPLIRDGAMKPEQAIIALHYCQRSRVTFEDAIDELGWERPSGL